MEALATSVQHGRRLVHCLVECQHVKCFLQLEGVCQHSEPLLNLGLRLLGCGDEPANTLTALQLLRDGLQLEEKLLARITALAPSLDIELLLARYLDDGICCADWSFGLGGSRDAAAMRRFREEELSMIRAHVVTWDPVTEQYVAPDTCPECMRAEFKRERDALAKAG